MAGRFNLKLRAHFFNKIDQQETLANWRWPSNATFHRQKKLAIFSSSCLEQGRRNSVLG